MRAILTFFTNLFDLSLKTGLKKLLFGAGLGVVSAGVSLLIINYFISKIVYQSSLIASAVGIFGLAGVDKAMSIIIGAYVVKATINSGNLSLKKLSK